MPAEDASQPTWERRPHLRLTTFRPLDSHQEVDAHLRGSMAMHGGQHGHRWSWLARRTDAAGHELVLVSLWTTRPDAEEALEASELLSQHPRPAARIAEVRTEILPVRIYESFERTVPMTVMRLFRGRTRPGELEAYLAEAQAGTITDGQRQDGLGALVSATDGTASFVSVSAWPDWSAIERCTGGDIRHPLSTRNTARLESGAPVHYELVSYEFEVRHAPSGSGSPAGHVGIV